LTQRVYKQFDPYKPYKSVPLLLKIYKELSKLPSAHWVDIKKKEVHHLIGICSGLWIESISSKAEVVNNQNLNVSVNVLNRSPLDIILQKIELPIEKKMINVAEKLENNIFNKKQVNYKIKNGYLHPYWLKKKQKKGLFNFERKYLGLNGLPYPYTVKVHLDFSGTRLIFSIPVVFKWRDPVKGEQIEKLSITPPATVNFPERIFFSLFLVK